MILDLLGVVRTEHNKIEKEVQLDMDVVVAFTGDYNIVGKGPFMLSISHVKDGQILLKGETNIKVEIPCDRCLETVIEEINLEVDKDIKLSDVKNDDQHMLEETNYIDGYNLDVDKLLFNEILLGWPMKTLCTDDCEGVCNTCGRNLKQGTCNCEDTSLDPRMSAIQDIFMNNKEV